MCVKVYLMGQNVDLNFSLLTKKLLWSNYYYTTTAQEHDRPLSSKVLNRRTPDPILLGVWLAPPEDDDGFVHRAAMTFARSSSNTLIKWS